MSGPSAQPSDAAGPGTGAVGTGAAAGQAPRLACHACAAGPSGSGKTAFSAKIKDFMPGVTVLSLDNYNDASRLIDGNFDGAGTTASTHAPNMHVLQSRTLRLADSFQQREARCSRTALGGCVQSLEEPLEEPPLQVLMACCVKSAIASANAITCRRSVCIRG